MSGDNGGGWRDMGSLAVHILTGRWFMFFSCLLIMSASGGTYIFGIFSDDIKTSLAYDQKTLNLVSFSKEIGANIGIIAGLINEVAPTWAVLLLGAVMNFSGYFFIWLGVTRRIANPRVWWICLCICIGANSQTFVHTGALVTLVKNFPESRGIVIGLLKGYVGLSGAIMTQLYHALYGNDDDKSLILLIAWLPAAVSCVFLGTIRITTVVPQSNEVKVFYNLLFVSLGLALALMVIIILQNRVAFSRADYAATVSVIIVLVFSPLVVVIKQELKLWRSKCSKNPPPFMVKTAVAPPSSQMVETRSNHVWYKNVFTPPERGEDYTIPQAVLSIDMLVLFVVTMTGAGGSLTAMDNLGQIGKSLGYPDQYITTFVSLVSIWGYLGRVVSGFCSEIFLAKYKFPRPLMLTFVLLLSCSGHLLIAFGVPNSLYAASVLIGFCFGALWPLIFSIISELFGLKHYSTLVSFGGAASPAGSYIFNVRVAGFLYDNEAMKQMGIKAGEELTCYGVECFKVGFMIIAAATFGGCIVSLMLVARTRKFYRGDIYKKFREQAQVEDEPGS